MKRILAISKNLLPVIVLALLLSVIALPFSLAWAQEESTANYYTIKYNADGNMLWGKAYDGGKWDMAYGVAVDLRNNSVIVTGSSEVWHDYDKNGEEDEGEVNYDYYTIKYDSNGNKIWDATYGGEGHGRDDAFAVAVDEEGNIIVTGRSFNGTDDDYRTIKYNGSTGAEIWNVTYGGGHADCANSVAVDSGNNIIVTGYAQKWYDYDGNGEVDSGELVSDYCTIKYNGSDGSEAWDEPLTYTSSQEYQGEDLGTGDGATTEFTLAHPPVVPESETIYLGGAAQERDIDYTIAQAYDAGTRTWTCTITFDAAPESGAVITADYTVVDASGALEVVVDSAHNIIVTGAAGVRHGGEEESNTDYYTIKYDSAGTELWHKDYDSGHSDTAYGLAVDSVGNVIVTGVAGRITDEPESGHYYTIKYNSAGTELWHKDYDTEHSDTAYSAAVDSTGNIIITGSPHTPGSATAEGSNIIFNPPVYYSYTTIKYSPNGGDPSWAAVYDANDQDSALDVAVDAAGNIIVTGWAQGNTADQGSAAGVAGGGLPAGAIAGIVIGACAVGGGGYYLIKRIKRKKRKPTKKGKRAKRKLRE